MAKDWTFIRIERFALQELERMRVRFLTGEMLGRSKLEKDDRGRFSLTRVILRLVREYDLKVKREERYRARKKGGKPTDGETATD